MPAVINDKKETQAYKTKLVQNELSFFSTIYPANFPFMTQVFTKTTLFKSFSSYYNLLIDVHA